MISNRRTTTRTTSSSFLNDDNKTLDGGSDEKTTKIAAQSARRQKSILFASFAVCGFVTALLLVHYQYFSSSTNTSRFLEAFTSHKSFHLKRKEQIFPRKIQLLSNSPIENITVDHTRALNDREMIHDSDTSNHRSVEPMTSIHMQRKLANSHDYDKHAPDKFETKDCKAQYPWQLTSIPTCNTFHEVGMRVGTSDKNTLATPVALINNGYWRDVWKVEDHSNGGDDKHVETIILKTQRAEHEFTARNMDRNRRDALVMEHLTASPWILDIYGFCGSSGISEFASKGSIEDAIFSGSGGSHHHHSKSTVSTDYVRYGKFVLWHSTFDIRGPLIKKCILSVVPAVQATMGLSALHNFDREGRSSIAHTDVGPSQFVMVANGRVKLNDFNRARFLRWNAQKQKVCTFEVGSNPGKNRAPEEYAYKPETEKVRPDARKTVRPAVLLYGLDSHVFHLSVGVFSLCITRLIFTRLETFFTCCWPVFGRLIPWMTMKKRVPW